MAIATTTTTHSPLAQSVPDMASQAADKAHEAIDRTADKIKPVVTKLADAAHHTIDRVAEKAIPAAEWAQTTAQRTSNSTARLVDQCGSAVRERPLVSVAAAMAIGYFIGRLMR
ncbi:hypothetical protein BURK1_02911 [Burkholderiales bacterium]|nr:hypothetical protein BURK1_02911 [Burkholderiales bacterium]